MKKGFLKETLNSFKPVIRGVVKSIPFGNIICEIIDNVKGKNIKPEQLAQSETGEIVDVKPHKWRSIILQALIVSGIIYSLYTKQIDINDFINLLTNLLK